MLFTPLLPNAGPTGGEGEAWPAPTISLTIWSFCIAFFAIVYVYDVVGLRLWRASEVRNEERREVFPS